MTTILGIILIVMSVFLIIAVLMQHGKTHNLSGTIAGGAETFFGKSKGQTIDKKLSVITTIIAIIFVCLVLAVYLIQDSTDFSGNKSTYTGAEMTEAPAGEVADSDSAATTTKATNATADATATATATDDAVAPSESDNAPADTTSGESTPSESVPSDSVSDSTPVVG